MNKFVEILVGLILLIAPIYIWVDGSLLGWGMGEAALVVLKGGVMWGLILIGLLFLILGISDLKD
jgi:hypothetical protein